MSLSTIPEILAELRAGRMVVLVDEEDRENEGDLVMVAEHVSAEAINFMARHGRGLRPARRAPQCHCRHRGRVDLRRHGL
jgi:3,4-dihydroxy-2-butanone 4-phosphate synthase